MRTLFTLIALFCYVCCSAQPGKLDSSFGKNGFIISDSALYFSTAIQQDGKIVVAGAVGVDFAVARYNSNGSLDTTFSSDGLQTTHFTSGMALASSIAVQQDGKIVLAGYASINGGQYDFAIARYNPDGILDKSFSGDGKQVYNIGAAYTFAEAVAIQRDGKIVVAGYSYSSLAANADFTVARMNADGSVDRTFSGDGKQITDFGNSNNDYIFSVAIQADGKIVAGGFSGDNIESDGHNTFALARYNTNGSPDSSFSEDGKQITDFGFGANAYSIALQDDNKILLAGRIFNKSYDFAVARYNADGSPDNTFSDDGQQITAFGGEARANTIAVQSDGKIILAGEYKLSGSRNTDCALARYYPDGSLDSNFSDDGIEITENIAPEDRVSAIVINQNKLYAVGVARYGQFLPFTGLISRYFLEAPVPNQLPLVTITAPGRDTNFIVPGPILLNAFASDSDGTIQSVDFYNDGTTLLLTDSTAPFSVVWFPVPTGRYQITAVATDNKGAKGTSTPVRITVLHNRPPKVNITTPAEHSTYIAGSTIVLSASAVAHGSKIKSVDFYQGSKLLFTEFAPPYLRKWYNVKQGSYIITAKAIDIHGRSTLSSPVSITVIPAGVSTINKALPPVYSNELVGDIRVSLSPNPARDFLNLKATGAGGRKPLIAIISASGAAVKITQTALYQSTKINVSSLAPGIYFIKLISGDKVIYRQFVKM